MTGATPWPLGPYPGWLPTAVDGLEAPAGRRDDLAFTVGAYSSRCSTLGSQNLNEAELTADGSFIQTETAAAADEQVTTRSKARWTAGAKSLWTARLEYTPPQSAGEAAGYARRAGPLFVVTLTGRPECQCQSAPG